jgi:DHA1 family bicyclomycin/chloramphenicol resistance-like MFS transporter
VADLAEVTGAPAPRRRLGRVAVLLTAVVGLGALSIDMFLPSLPALAVAYGTDAATAQLTVTLFLAGLAPAQLAWGPLSDRYGRRRTLLAGLVLYTAAGLGCALAPGIRSLILARVVQAFGAGSGQVIARAIVRDVYPRAEAARVLALMGTAQALTPILAPVLGGLLHAWLGWRSVFFVLTGFGAVFVLAAARLAPETNVRPDATALRPARFAENVATVLRDRAYVAYVLVVTFMFCGQFAFISGSSFVLIGGLGVPPAVYGVCFAAVAVGIMTGSFITSRLAGRLPGDRMITTGTALGAAGGLVMAALAWGGVVGVAPIIAPMFFFALGLGLANPNAVAGAVSPYPHMAGLAAAVLGVTQMTGSALYGITVGRLSDGTAAPMALAIASAGLAATLSFRLLRSRETRRTP